MAWELDGQTEAVEQALAGGTPQRAGWFRFYFEDQRWEWSEQVQRMHGYEPGTVTPTTEVVLSHKHPDDRGQVAATINDMVELVYGVDEDAAFNLLKSLSQIRNTKLMPLAQQITEDFAAVGREAIASRSRFDQRLLTAHTRAPRS